MAESELDLNEIRDRYHWVAAGFDARVATVADLEWNHQTPCEDWNTRDLLSDVVNTHRRVLAALADEARAQQPVTFFGGEQPFAAPAGGLLCADTLVHTWDLARATDQDETLDPAAVDAAMALLVGFGDGIRRPGGFGPAVEPPAGADAQAQLVSYCGREV